MSIEADRMFRQVTTLRWALLALVLADFLYSLLLLWQVISRPEQVWFYRVAFGAVLRSLAPAVLGFMVFAESLWAALGFAGFKLFMLMLLALTMMSHSAVGAEFSSTPFLLLGVWHVSCLGTGVLYFALSRRLEEFLRYDFEDIIVREAHPKDLIARKLR